MERDDLIAFAEAKGLRVDRRLGDEKLAESIEAQLAERGEEPVSRDWGDEPAAPVVEDIATPAVEVAATFNAPAEPEPSWPKRIAPCVWLDQSGRRHTDLGRARAAVDRIRGS